MARSSVMRLWAITSAGNSATCSLRRSGWRSGHGKVPLAARIPRAIVILAWGYSGNLKPGQCVVQFKERHSRKEPVMRNQIVGTTMPVLEFTLDPNDSIISEAGQLSWMG